MIEPAFRSLLIGAAPVADIVADRVHFNATSQDERRPRIVLLTISAVPGRTFQGRGGYVIGRMRVHGVPIRGGDAQDGRRGRVRVTRGLGREVG